MNPVASSVLSVAIGGSRFAAPGRSMPGAFNPNAGGASANPAQGDPLAAAIDGLFSEFGAQQRVHGESRRLLERVRNALTDLRAMLQGVRDQRSGRSPQLTLTTREGETRKAIYDQRLGTDPAAYITENVYETRTVYESRDVYGVRDNYEIRNSYTTENIYETQPVYEQQAIYGAVVTGTRDLSSYAKLSDAGIQTGSDFSVQVGNGPLAVVKFTKQSEISVTVSGTTRTFSFATNGGGWRQSLTNALNSITGLDASFTANGRLELKTRSAESLTIADVPNGLLDFTASPLGSLGLTAGTTQPTTITGYNNVQVGTEEVVVGTKQVLARSEKVLVGTEPVVTGTEQIVVGREQVKVGTRDVISDPLTTDRTMHDKLQELRDTLSGANSSAAEFAKAMPPSGDPAKKGLAAETVDLLRDLGVDELGDAWSTASIERSLSRIDAALKRIDELGAKHAKPVSLQETVDRMGALLQSGTRHPATPTDALIMARDAARQLGKSKQPIGAMRADLSVFA